MRALPRGTCRRLEKPYRPYLRGCDAKAWGRFSTAAGLPIGMPGDWPCWTLRLASLAALPPARLARLWDEHDFTGSRTTPSLIHDQLDRRGPWEHIDLRPTAANAAAATAATCWKGRRPPSGARRRQLR